MLHDLFSTTDIQLLPILFTCLSPTEELFENVKLILCNPPSSLSSVKQPVDFIMQEGGNAKLSIKKLLIKFKTFFFLVVHFSC